MPKCASKASCNSNGQTSLNKAHKATKFHDVASVNVYIRWSKHHKHEQYTSHRTAWCDIFLQSIGTFYIRRHVVRDVQPQRFWCHHKLAAAEWHSWWSRCSQRLAKALHYRPVQHVSHVNTVRIQLLPVRQWSSPQYRTAVTLRVVNNNYPAISGLVQLALSAVTQYTNVHEVTKQLQDKSVLKNFKNTWTDCTTSSTTASVLSTAVLNVPFTRLLSVCLLVIPVYFPYSFARLNHHWRHILPCSAHCTYYGDSGTTFATSNLINLTGSFCCHNLASFVNICYATFVDVPYALCTVLSLCAKWGG